MSDDKSPYRSMKDAENLRRCGVPSASVHPLETTVIHTNDSLSLRGDLDGKIGVNFRHSGWAAHRQKIWESLIRTEATSKRLDRFRNCGSQPYVYQSTDDVDVYRLGGNYCHDKLCRPCSSQRARLVAGNLARAIIGRDLRFLTLTIRGTDDKLDNVLEHLTASFRRMRATPLWKAHVFGGCAFTEVKYNFDPDHWHVHIHMLIEGTYFPQSTIKALWQTASRGSFIVYINPVRDHWGGANEVAKYAGKPMDHALIYRPNLLDQAAVALQRRRLFTCFGKWRGFKLSQLPEKGHWKAYESLHSLLEKHRNDDMRATQVLMILGIVDLPIMFGAAHQPRPPPQAVNSTIIATQALLFNTPRPGGPTLSSPATVPF